MSGADDRPESWVFDRRYRTVLEECENEDAMSKQIERDYRNGKIVGKELDYANKLAAIIADERNGRVYENGVEKPYAKKPNGFGPPPKE